MLMFSTPYYLSTFVPSYCAVRNISPDHTFHIFLQIAEDSMQMKYHTISSVWKNFNQHEIITGPATTIFRRFSHYVVFYMLINKRLLILIIQCSLTTWGILQSQKRDIPTNVFERTDLFSLVQLTSIWKITVSNSRRKLKERRSS